MRKKRSTKKTPKTATKKTKVNKVKEPKVKPVKTKELFKTKVKKIKLKPSEMGRAFTYEVLKTDKSGEPLKAVATETYRGKIVKETVYN